MKICQPCLFGDHEQIGHESDCSCPCHGQQVQGPKDLEDKRPLIIERNQHEIHLVRQRSTVTPIEFASWC